MPKKRSTDRPVKVQTWLPTSLKARVDLFLYSPAEGRVPYGAFAKLVETLLTDYLDKAESLIEKEF
jgi:hypothetical protein